MTLGNSMLIPILPVMEDKLDISKLQSSYIITVYSIVAIIFIPLAGYLSDRFGRKKVLIPALVLTGIGGLIAGLAAWKMDNAFTVILIGRILQGIGASGAMPIVLPLVGDMFRRDEEASATLGIIETSNTVGKVLSPILGAALTALIWFLPFFSIPLFCLISLLDRKSTRLNSSHVSISYMYTLSLHDALPISSGAMPIVLPLVGDMFRRDEEASATLGIIETSNTVGKVLSPILGAALTALIWFLPFFSIPLFCLISLLMVIFLIKEEEKDAEMTFSVYWDNIKTVFQQHSRWLIAVFIIGAI